MSRNWLKFNAQVKSIILYKFHFPKLITNNLIRESEGVDHYGCDFQACGFNSSIGRWT